MCELFSTPPDTNRGLACAKQPVVPALPPSKPLHLNLSLLLTSCLHTPLQHYLPLCHCGVCIISPSLAFFVHPPGAGNRSLSEKLRRELAPGTRIVTYIFRCVPLPCPLAP